MITSINPKVSAIICVVALVGIETEVSYGSSLIAAFIGFILTLPLIRKVWNTMEDNWPLYRRFYSMGFGNRRLADVRKSWRLTWWLVPYTVIIYSIADVTILFNPFLGSELMFLWGVILCVFFYTFLESPKYYEDLKRARK